MADRRSTGPSTTAVHAGEGPDPATGAVATPIHLTAPFSSPDVATLAKRAAGEGGWIYSRNGNPTVAALEEKVARLEDPAGDAAGVAFGSGMGALAAVFHAAVPAGGTLLAADEIYGGTDALLGDAFPGAGRRVVRVATSTEELVAGVLRERPTAVFLETPTNPNLRVVDLEPLAAACAGVGARLLVDSTFATPVLTRPLSLGAFAVVHSATKYLSGHSDVTAGVAVGSASFAAELRRWRDRLGASLDPHAAWLVLRGAKTLALRVTAQSENALAVARYLAGQPGLARVNYPGLEAHPGHRVAGRQMGGRFGGMLSFELAGGGPAVDRFLAALSWIRLVPSLGGVETGLSIPAVTSHRSLTPEGRLALGITDGLVRMSAGIEDTADLLAEVGRGLAAASRA